MQCPAIDLTAFTAVANAAVDVGSSQAYNALTPQFTVEGSPMNIFLAAFFLEDVGVAMYQGLVPSIQSQDLRAAVTGACFIPKCLLSSPSVWSHPKCMLSSPRLVRASSPSAYCHPHDWCVLHPQVHAVIPMTVWSHPQHC